MIHNLLKIVIILSLVAFWSCGSKSKPGKEAPLARVYDIYLYPSDIIKGIVPEGLTGIDSIVLVKDYIDKWIKKQLFLKKAELSLLDEEKNVRQQIEDYRSSLLIFKFEQNYLEQKLDTIIPDDEIANYYEANSSNFILNTNIIKGHFIQIPRSAQDIYKIRRWYRSESTEDYSKLEEYCFQFAEKYQYFDDEWIEAENILKLMPSLGYRTENLLRYRKNIEVKDTNYYYFLKIADYKLASDIAPLDYVDDKIESIILNKRKIQLINKLESEIYNDALNRGHFNVY